MQNQPSLIPDDLIISHIEDLSMESDIPFRIIDIMMNIKSNPDIKIIEEVIAIRHTINSERDFVILAWLHEVIAKHPEFMFELANPLLIEQAAKFVDDMDAIVKEHAMRFYFRDKDNKAEAYQKVQLYTNSTIIICAGFRYCVSGNREILESIKGRVHSAKIFSAMIYLIGPELASEFL